MGPIEQLHYIAKKIKSIPSLNPPFEHSDNLIEDFTLRVDTFYSLMKELSKDENLSIMAEVPNRLRSIEALKLGIIDSLKYHLSGNLNESYKRFDQALSKTKIIDYLSETAIPLNRICNSFQKFYRVRTSHIPLSSREELFHIPFKLRHKVNTQRYSISGLPCLYLGSSILVCWHEMGKPDFDKLYISAFSGTESSSDLKIIDLAFNLTSTLSFTMFDRLENDTQNLFEKAKSKIVNLILWPLVLACNYRKKHNESFNIEYIIPNLLMEWVSSSKAKNLSGIAYRTTKFINGNNQNIGINLILPPKHEEMINDNLAYCPTLSKSFKLTNPISWQVFRTLNSNFGENSYTPRAELFPNNGTIDNFDDFLVDNYNLTEFSHVEKLIGNLMKFDYVKNEIQ